MGRASICQPTGGAAQQTSATAHAVDSTPQKTVGVARTVERVPRPVPPAPPVLGTPSCFGGKLFPSTPFSRRDDFAHITDVEIYYGTMFGSAEQYARSLAHEVSVHRPLRVTIHDLDGFEDASFSRERLTPMRLFVFVLSTHFAGSPSPSAERFHHWITNLTALPQVTSPPAKSTTDKTLSPTKKASWAAPFQTRIRRQRSLSARWRQTPLAGMHYVVFGIGDSMYLRFNAMAKSVDARLKELGATRLLPVGLGDCSNNVEAIYKAWEIGLLHRLPRAPTSVIGEIRRVSRTAVRRLSQLSPAITPSTGRPPVSLVTGPVGSVPRTGDVQLCNGVPAYVVHDNFGRIVPLRFQCIDHGVSLTQRALLPVSVRSNSPTRSLGSFSSRSRSPRTALFDDTSFAEIVPVERVGNGSRTNTQRLPERTSGLFKVRLLNPMVTYTTVSTLAIFPHNDPEQVQDIADMFHYDLDAEIDLDVDEACYPDHIELKAERHQLPFPTPCTIRTALTEFLEIRTVTPEFVRVAAGFVVSLDDKELLESMSSTDGSTTFRTQIQDQHKGVLDLIAMAPTLQIPWAVFVNVAQPIKPRYFTIASSPRGSPRDLDIAVAFGSTSQPQGLATSFFDGILTTQSVVPVRGFVSVSRFKFRDNGVSPMVFIASGVGVAAMRAIIQDRLMQWAQMATTDHGRSTPTGSIAATLPKQLLFLGAANEQSVVFLNDMRRWEQQLVIQVRYAFSRDDNHPRRYVQDVVGSRMDEIVATVKSSPGARIFVCGRVAMVRRIREIFESDQRHRGSAWFSAMHKSGRFIEEGYY